MAFKKGQSGNPAGKKPGTRNKTTVLLEALLDGKAEALTKKAIEMAGKGDPAMMRLCIERLIPPRKDRPINFDLPPLQTTQDASARDAENSGERFQGRADAERGVRNIQGDRELRGHGSTDGS